MADDTTKIDATTQKIAETVKKVNDAMADSADLASKMVDIFKKLNVEMGKNQNALKLSNSFNKQILSDTKARAMIEDQMASDIKDAEKTILKAKMANIKAVSDLSDELNKKLESAQKSKLKNDAMAMANSRNILELENKRRLLSEKYNLLSDKNSTSAMLIKKQMMSSESEWTGLIKERNNLSERGAKIDDNIWRTSENIKDAAAAYIKETENAIKNAKVELKLRQDLLKNIRLQMGFMAHVERGGYAILGPFGEMVTKAKQFSENIKVIPKRFMLLDALIKSAIDRFVALDKAAEDFRKQTGFSNTQMVELRKNAESINVEFQDTGVGITEVYASAKALTDVFGRTSLVSREAMQNVSLMSVNLGVAAEDSANVLATFQGLGGATQEVAMNVMKVGAGFSEKAGIPFSLVMKDIANASEQTTAMLGANPSKLMKSAIAARALGTDLNKIVSSQRKLLDFSSSINEELEASALLGRSISFQKARQLAYDGDIEGAAKATLDSVKAAGDFNAMNVYQREALAKASGMELKDLTKMMAVEAQRQEIELRGTDEQKAKLKMQTEALAKLKEENDLSKEGLLAEGERAIRQQKMQGQMTKLKNIMESLMVSLGDILEPIITMLSDVVVPVFGGIAKVLRSVLEPISWIAKGISSIFDKTTSWSEASEKVSEQFKNWETGLLTVAKILGSLLLTATLLGKVGVGGLTKTLAKIPGLGGLSGGASAVGKVGDIAKSAKSGGFGESLGKGISSFMKYIAKGIGYFGSTNVLKGALGIALVGASIIPFAFAMQMFSGIDWKSVGIGSLALLGFTAAAFGLGALLSTGVGAAIFGAGVIGIAALGAALIPFAAAALMAGAGIKMLGEGISSSVDPILRLSQIDLTKTALGIGAVGVALAAFGAGSAAAGLGSFVGGLLAGDPIKKMERLGAVGEKLKMTAEAISEISNVMSTFTVVDSFAKSIDTLADSLSNLNDQVEKISVLKLAAITAISAAGAATAAAPAAATNLNTGGIEAKLDTLTNLLTGGAVRVYLDGKDVSAAMTGIGR